MVEVCLEGRKGRRLMARHVLFGNNLLDLDSVRAVTYHRPEGWLEIDTSGQPLIVEGKTRAEAIWRQLRESLKPPEWQWPQEDMDLRSRVGGSSRQMQAK